MDQVGLCYSMVIYFIEMNYFQSGENGKISFGYLFLETKIQKITFFRISLWSKSVICLAVESQFLQLHVCFVIFIFNLPCFLLVLQQQLFGVRSSCSSTYSETVKRLSLKNSSCLRLEERYFQGALAGHLFRQVVSQVVATVTF